MVRSILTEDKLLGEVVENDGVPDPSDKGVREELSDEPLPIVVEDGLEDAHALVPENIVDLGLPISFAFLFQFALLAWTETVIEHHCSCGDLKVCRVAEALVFEELLGLLQPAILTPVVLPCLNRL